MPSISQTTVSPGWRKRGGFSPMPTPAGVPVARMVPGRSVVPWLKMESASAMLVMKLAVVLLCRSSSLT